ncbi:MerR family transcriptional regulator [Corynebacterium breve]|uniref:MerR family transcriptional regulator n=1 Tax=Corynebacterium breve TaxID=3049799 RepID=A0ABY8VFK9_9CORY|nr:MerR family transcriptional regulator [Corynebacterium breve]WIM67555.1 MerR family transcriptional regulator [Corynebacterium breve]
MRISDVARAADCSVRAIRHMHNSGAVPEPARLSNSYRDYSLHDVAAVLRARILVDAGVPLSRLNSPTALSEAISLIDDQLARLELQRTKLIALQENPAGTPTDVREGILATFGDSDYVHGELASFDVMALTGVASQQTWDQLRLNLADPDCIAATREFIAVWEQLGDATHLTDEVATLQSLLPNGLLRGIFDTLSESDLPLTLNEIPLRGAQVQAFKALTGDV